MTKHTGLVVVTGATGGVGRPLVDALTRDGYEVLALGHSAPASPPRAGVHWMTLDIANEDSIAALAETVRVRAGGRGLVGLINLAGMIVEGPLELVRPADLQRQFAVNAIGPAAITRALLPFLRLARGRVVNVGAITARVPVPFFGAVAASKAALASLNDTMRMEFSPFGVKVILIEPGALKTGIFSKSAALQREALGGQGREVVELYDDAMKAARSASEKTPADNPLVVVSAVLQAMQHPNPKLRTAVGKGTGMLVLLSKLPTRTRDSLLLGSLGIARAMAATLQRQKTEGKV